MGRSVEYCHSTAKELAFTADVLTATKQRSALKLTWLAVGSWVLVSLLVMVQQKEAISRLLRASWMRCFQVSQIEGCLALELNSSPTGMLSTNEILQQRHKIRTASRHDHSTLITAKNWSKLYNLPSLCERETPVLSISTWVFIP